MKTLTIRNRKSLALILDDDSSRSGTPTKVWQAICYADSPCWIVTDVRLSAHKIPGPYATSVDADDFHSEIKPASDEEAEFIKERVKNHREDPDGTIHWCSFDGMPKGYPHVNQYVPPSYKNFHGPGYFSRREALELLQESRHYWDIYSGDPKKAKVHNVNWQPNEWIVRQEFIFQTALKKLSKKT